MFDSDKVCCFCGEVLPVSAAGYLMGNNPDNACSREGARCCNWCDWNIVIPVRMVTDKIITEALKRRGKVE